MIQSKKYTGPTTCNIDIDVDVEGKSISSVYDKTLPHLAAKVNEKPHADEKSEAPVTMASAKHSQRSLRTSDSNTLSHPTAEVKIFAFASA